MRDMRSAAGFTLVETMVAMLLFSFVSIAFYQVLFGQVRGTTAARASVRIGEEARAGFNRMVRDTREGDMLSFASPTSFTVKVNFNGNGLYESPNAQGNHEILTYAYDASAGTLTLNGEVLMKNVGLVPGQDPFSYGSNLLDYDWGGAPDGTPDGVTTWQEINDASCPSHGITGVGDCDTPPVLDGPEFPHITLVKFALRVSIGGTVSDFRSTVQLRNRV